MKPDRWHVSKRQVVASCNWKRPEALEAESRPGGDRWEIETRGPGGARPSLEFVQHGWSSLSSLSSLGIGCINMVINIHMGGIGVYDQTISSSTIPIKWWVSSHPPSVYQHQCGCSPPAIHPMTGYQPTGMGASEIIERICWWGSKKKPTLRKGISVNWIQLMYIHINYIHASIISIYLCITYYIYIYNHVKYICIYL